MAGKGRGHQPPDESFHGSPPPRTLPTAGIPKRQRNPLWHVHGYLAAAYAQNGQTDEARIEFETCQRESPEGFDIAAFIHGDARAFARQEDQDHWLDGYRKAGFDV